MSFGIIGWNIMKLHPQRELLVEKWIDGKSAELSPKYRSEIEKLKTDFWMPKADRKREILNVHTAQVQEISRTAVAKYLYAYQIEQHMPDDNDIVEMQHNLSCCLNKEIADCVAHLPLDLVLSAETETIIRDAVSNAAADLRIARTEEELNAKREEEKRMQQKLILENQKKQYRVLN